MDTTAAGGGETPGSISTSTASRLGLLPTFLIVGAQKAGTTALYYVLSKHPQVFMSEVKEPGYFSNAADALGAAAGPGDQTGKLMTSLTDYQALFTGGAELVRGEATTSYLYDSKAPEKIKHHIPDVKLIAILRDPVERAYSNFLYLVREGREPLHDFRSALAEEEKRHSKGWSSTWRYKFKGFYGAQIERYLDQFSRSQLRCYLYEDYNDDPRPVINDIYQFLEVDDTFSQDLSARLNVGGLPKSKGLQWASRRSRRLKWFVDPLVPDQLRRGLLKAQNSNLSRPPIPHDVRAELIEDYRDDIGQVAELTGLDVSPWLTIDDAGLS
jgi:hypothetical protein